MTERSAFTPSMIRGFQAAAGGLLALSLVLLGSAFLPTGEASATSLTGRTAHDVVTLTVDRPRSGETAVDIRLAPRAQAAVVTLQAVLPTAGHAGPETTALSEGDNRYRVAGVHLMMPGRWTFLVSIDRGGTRDQYDFPLTISG
ncbi:hypothetical protein ACLVWO_05915 [Streptomyces sp. CWNU-52H]|uniref:hypothetical protein n=1 Tax=Streptomyces sp. CWNU-52H TaxID=3394352 RepID=UPI0039BF4887